MDKPSEYEQKRLKKEQKELEKDVAKSKYKTKKIVRNLAIAAVLIIIVASISFVFSNRPKELGEHDDFAKCLTDNGVKMYGTDWCPHCKNQKELFGKSFKHVDYINCDLKRAECTSVGVKGYPTWIINEAKYSGTRQLSELATLSGCELL